MFDNVSLEDCSWSEIGTISQNGSASEVWSISDTKNISVSGESLTLEIVGFNHDDLTNGGKAGITFACRNLMTSKRRMYSEGTNEGGYMITEMHSWLNGELFNSLDVDLRSAIKTVNKITSILPRGENPRLETHDMKIFLLSIAEIFGSDTGPALAGEGVQYSAFSNSSKRQKLLSNGSGQAEEWWSRSTMISFGNGYVYVDTSGNWSGSKGSANLEKGVCFAFCV